ncbi:hypothetical protein SLS53_002920 [Cytospora paraplurivora]|uniref:Uncharacterized protein n=1 Tax=Cytospora paraplurivora TaxID=2898453 RepID=A0AAN9UD15_9PEZI
MGGKVFSSGVDPLYTPRMAPAVYEHAKEQCISALKALFPRVESPIEAPEKVSFGDIDILVSLEGSDFQNGAFAGSSVWTLIQEVLGGVRSRYEGEVVTDSGRVVEAKNIAIPWPTDLSTDECVAQSLLEAGQAAADVASASHVQGTEEAGEIECGLKDRYIQVDVRLCVSNQELDWRLFKHDHGDIWNMLGQTIRPFGLTADDTGLTIRIPEIEKENRKAARIFLTRRPTEVLDFLGLRHQNGEWKRPFRSVEDLFEYAASCRWFMLWPGSSTEAEEEEETKASRSDPNDANNKGGRDHSEETKKLKHNDRARMKQRPIFARWVEEFKPRCREQGRFLVSDPGKTPDQVRDEVRRLAFETFPESEAAYAAALAAWRREKIRIYVKNKVIKEDVCLPADISHALPAPQEGARSAPSDVERHWRGVLRSALAKILTQDDGGFGGFVPPALRDGDGVLVVEDVKDWIGRNWEEVGRVAWAMQCEKARARMEERRLAEGEAT